MLWLLFFLHYNNGLNTIYDLLKAYEYIFPLKLFKKRFYLKIARKISRFKECNKHFINFYLIVLICLNVKYDIDWYTEREGGNQSGAAYRTIQPIRKLHILLQRRYINDRSVTLFKENYLL